MSRLPVPQNILLIQDDSVAARVVQEALSASADGHFHAEWVQSCAKGVERLQKEVAREQHSGLAAVLVDPNLSDSQGMETFNQLFSVAPHIPILILSDAKNEPLAKLAVQKGAQDYLLMAHLNSYTLPKILGSMVERAAIAEALFEEKERAQVTLNSIGDAVICTDVHGRVTYLNVVAEKMAGWSWAEAAGRRPEEVLQIIDAVSREPAQNPMCLAIRDNQTKTLGPNCVLVRRDGVEAPIEDSAAPIHDRRGQVSGAVMVFRDVSVSHAMALRMTHLARHDALTDLPNRALLNDRLGQAMARAQRYQQQLALLFLDLDRFKHINDTLGHGVGDRLLQSVAQRLRDCVRNSDTVSRQGGDEFVVLLSEVKRAEDAAISADKLIKALGAPYRIDEHELHLTASIGIVIYPDDGAEADTLMKNADVAMYHAKDGGRNAYRFFKRAMNVAAVERQSLENDLRHGQDRREFALHYQPIINLATRAIVGVEALIRWNHPRRGLVPAAQFIPIAEECGLILPIGQWVLGEACRQARAWQNANLPPIRVAVNISAVELRATDFVAGVKAILAKTALEARFLELELTETSLIEDSESSAAVLQGLKDLGLQLALDDFGTGYSSLSYLKRYSIDSLKIDRSFVRHLTTDRGDAGIVSSVISMGGNLQMRIVAEGVETAEQVALLMRLGCLEGQGYHFGKAMSAAEMTLRLEGGAVGGAGTSRPVAEATGRAAARSGRIR